MTKAATLRVDYDCGEGSVELSRRFQAENALFRADVLSDWIRDLQIAYDEAVRIVHTDLAMQANSTTGEVQ